MILVTELKAIRVDRMTYQLAHIARQDWCEVTPLTGNPEDDVMSMASIEHEVVHGRTFVNPHGERVVLGLAPSHQELLGLPFEIFNRLQGQLMDTGDDLRRTKQKLQHVQRLGLWDRVKFAWTGTVPE